RRADDLARVDRDALGPGDPLAEPVQEGPGARGGAVDERRGTELVERGAGCPPEALDRKKLGGRLPPFKLAEARPPHHLRQHRVFCQCLFDFWHMLNVTGTGTVTR